MNPEVEIETAASGIFKLHDWGVIGSQTRMRGFAQYRMRFTRRSGAWQIERLDLRYRYRYREDHAVYLDGKPAWTTPTLGHLDADGDPDVISWSLVATPGGFSTHYVPEALRGLS